MQEVLRKTDDRSAPLKEQEYYELRLKNSDNIQRPGYTVMQFHAKWSEIDRQIMWDDFQVDQCLTIGYARVKYDLRRQALAQKGFIYSDIEMF
jgi:hypothetical protein